MADSRREVVLPSPALTPVAVEVHPHVCHVSTGVDGFWTQDERVGAQVSPEVDLTYDPSGTESEMPEEQGVPDRDDSDDSDYSGDSEHSFGLGDHMGARRLQCCSVAFWVHIRPMKGSQTTGLRARGSMLMGLTGLQL